MKERTDLPLVRALLKKQWTERANSFRKGNFDAVGFVMRVLLVALFLTAFIIFYGRFSDIYFSLRTEGVPDPSARQFELLSLSYVAILVFMTAGGISQLITGLFAADDIKLFSAMPVGAKSLYFSRLVVIYLRQLLYAAVTVLPVNITVAVHAGLPVGFYLLTVVLVLVFPLVSIGIASLLALPFYALWQFLKTRFVVNFIAVTAVLAGGLYLYSVLLTGVKELLLGDGLKYFFNEKVMAVLGGIARHAYPCNWFAGLALGRDVLISGLCLLAVVAVCIALSLVIIRGILSRALQSRIAGTPRFLFAKRGVRARLPLFFALMKKEFLQIFRTPSYMFSYFSVAVVMPLMVYFCMDVGGSLVSRLVGINCDLELAIFLTLLFGALTNVFCATNISRDGPMFYSVKAMPIGWGQVIFSKIALCMMVTLLSQAVSAIILMSFGFVSFGVGCFVFGAGVMCGFAQICLATRRDFNHARFSTEEDGEIKESGNSVTVVIALGMVVAFLLGGALLIIRMMLALRGFEYAYLSYLITGVFSVLAAAACCLYLVLGLGKKYYEFSGGGLL